MEPIYGLIASLVVVGVAAFVLYGRTQRLAKRNQNLQIDYEKARAEIRALADKERRASSKLDERVTEVQQLKKDLGAQKKKAHQVAEELKSLRAELKAAREEAKNTAKSRPAFSSSTPAAAPKPDSSTDDERALEESKHEIEGLKKSIEELQASLETLGREKSVVAEKMESALSEVKRANAESRRAKRRVDEYRRADQVARSRNELVDDKLRHLSRQYYEVVSELAALKGEVTPPPRQIDEVRRDAAMVEREAEIAHVEPDHSPVPSA